MYDRSGSFLRDYPISSDELTKAIIGTIGEFDAYQLPDAKGYASLVRYLTGIDDDYRQQMRDQVLATKAEHFAEFAAVLDQAVAAGRVAVLGSADAIAAASAAREDWLTPVKVL